MDLRGWGLLAPGPATLDIVVTDTAGNASAVYPVLCEVISADSDDEEGPGVPEGLLAYSKTKEGVLGVCLSWNLSELDGCIG